MKIQRICFLGTRTRNFDATAGFFRDVLGLNLGHAEPGWSVFQLPSGRSDFVEVFGTEHDNANAFAVDDLVDARAELSAAKVELIGDLVWASELFADASMEGFGWFFFRAPDRNVYAMQQDSRTHAA